MRRREFVATAAGAGFAWPLRSLAQQQGSQVVGFLNIGSPGPMASFVLAFRRGVAETGLVEGRHFTLEYRWAESDFTRLPMLIDDLVHRNVAVIVATGGTAAVLAAKAADTNIPIVFGMGDDPVKLGLVTSLNRPAGNITGVTYFTTTLVAKRVEILSEFLTATKVVGVLMNANNPIARAETEEVRAAARSLGMDVQVATTNSENDLDTAYASFAKTPVGALIVNTDNLFVNRRVRLIQLAAHHAIPTIYTIREYTDAGGLMSYGASRTDAYRQVGVYTGEILKGAKPGNMPVLQPTKFELVINLKTAKALGLTVPPSLLIRADEVIE